MFLRDIDGDTFSYPIPTHDKDINDCYVKGARRRLKLTREDGVSDEDFFGRA